MVKTITCMPIAFDFCTKSLFTNLNIAAHSLKKLNTYAKKITLSSKKNSNST